MVKVEVSDKKGLVQYAGQDGFSVVDADGLTVKSAHMSAQLKIISETKTLGDGDTAHTIASMIPAGSIILCGEVAVETASAGGSSFNITSIGTSNDTDAFSGTIALDGNAVGSQVLSPIALMPAGDDNSDADVDVVITTGSTGTQTTDGVVRISLFVAAAGVTGQTI
jgi:hypothetical protein